MKNIPINVLGFLWDNVNDTLSINIESVISMNTSKVTKKVILGAAHRIYDPISVTCGVSLVPKILLYNRFGHKV